jgi:uncharacterized protein YyaL (SSP411 family)
MIAALARAGRALGRPEYTAAAGNGAEFMLAHMRRSDGRLLHRYRDGDAGITANLSDYAFLIWGFIDLYESTYDAGYLETALDLNETMLTYFWDEEGGGLYFTPDDGEDLLVRKKDSYDGAIPSGNSVAMLNMLRLGRMTGRVDLEGRAARIGEAFSASVNESPVAHTQLLVALDFAVGPSYEVVIAGDPEAEDTREMLKALLSPFIPNKVVLLRPDGEDASEIGRLAGFTESHSSTDGKATAYVCQNHNCELPTTDPAKLLNLLGIKSPGR